MYSSTHSNTKDSYSNKKPTYYNILKILLIYKDQYTNMQNNTNRPLIEPNPYPTIQEQNDIVVGLTGQNTYNTYQNNPYALNQPNQPIP